MEIISSHKVVRDNTRLLSIEPPKKSCRVFRDGQTFIEKKTQSYEEYVGSLPDSSLLSLSNVIKSGISPSAVNPIFIDGHTSEFTQRDNDVALLEKMTEIENHFNENNNNSTADIPADNQTS